MGTRQRRGGLIQRGLVWARRLAGGAPAGAAPPPVSGSEAPGPPRAAPVPPTAAPVPPAAAPVPPAAASLWPEPESTLSPDVSDRLELARHRLKDAIPPREP